MKKPQSRAEKRNADRERIARQRRELIHAGIHARIIFLSDGDWASLLRDFGSREVVVPRTPAEALRHYIARQPGGRPVARPVLSPTVINVGADRPQLNCEPTKVDIGPRKRRKNPDGERNQTAFLFAQ